MRYVCCDPMSFLEPTGCGSSDNASTAVTIRATTSLGNPFNSRSAEGFQLMRKEAIAAQLLEHLLVRQRRLLASLGDGGEIVDIFEQFVELLDRHNDAHFSPALIGQVLNVQILRSNHLTSTSV